MMSVRKLAKRVLPKRVVGWIRKQRAATARKERSSRESSAVYRKSEPTVDHIIGLEVMLFSTGNHVYAEKLAHSVRSATRGSEAQLRGTVALARWSYYQGTPQDALRDLDKVSPPDALQMSIDLLRVDCLCELGEGQAALSLLAKMIGRQTGDQDLVLRVGHARSVLNTPEDHGSGSVIEALNTIYHGAGFGMLRRPLVMAPIGLDNISCEVPDAEPRDSLPRVSVITWLRDPITDMMGISSLLGQSWRNLEVLVLTGVGGEDRLSAVDPNLVDDARVVFVDDIADSDHLLRPGLKRATGELITMHQPGSWAHPQRVEAQASALMVNPDLRGTISSHMYVADHLRPRPFGLVPKEDLVGPNPDSVMLRVSGTPPAELLAEYDRTKDHHSRVTGDLSTSEGIDLVKDGVPLTLSRGRVASATPAGKAGSS